SLGLRMGCREWSAVSYPQLPLPTPQALGEPPFLVGPAAAAPQHEAAATAVDVQAEPGLGATDRPVGVESPLLVGPAIAGVRTDRGAVGRSLAVDIEAFLAVVDGDLPRGGPGPLLVGPAVAGIGDHLDIVMSSAGNVEAVAAVAQRRRARAGTGAPGVLEPVEAGRVGCPQWNVGT